MHGDSLRRGPGLRLRLFQFGILFVLGLALRHDEDIESFELTVEGSEEGQIRKTRQNSSLEARRYRKRRDVRRTHEGCEEPQKMDSAQEEALFNTQCGSCQPTDGTCLKRRAICIFDVRVQHYQSGMKAIADKVPRQDLQNCSVQIELPTEDKPVGAKEVRDFDGSCLKSCLEEEAHGDFEANMEEDICDGVPGSEGVHFGCLVMVTPE
ncbi:unnamed protein product [Symbiodinium natans]|uniref:Uncharacterized protein n=1 Tax=Symbiodinium natans TaxID=878477 RepID=A0A812HEI3_9DINO|nr:unnamed protein product [Symbiodinium natans]